MTVYTIDADAACRALVQDGATYSTVRGNTISKAPEISGFIGQYMNSGQSPPFTIGRQVLIFDTSSVPKSETVSSVVLRLKCLSKFCNENFNFVIQMGDAIHPGNPVVIQDYAIGNGVGADGDYTDSISTSTFDVEGTFDLTFTPIGRLLIEKGGETRLMLRSSRDVTGIEPDTDKYDYIEFYDSSTGFPPQLIITTTPPVESSGAVFEYLSDNQESVTISADETPRDFPDVVVPALPTGYTIYRATMFFKCRAIENSNASDNKLSGDQTIIIQKDSGPFMTAMRLKDDMFPVDGSGVSDGVTVYSEVDIKAVVSGAGTYSIRIQGAHADYSSLYLKDVQAGIRIVMKNY